MKFAIFAVLALACMSNAQKFEANFEITGYWKESIDTINYWINNISSDFYNKLEAKLKESDLTQYLEVVDTYRKNIPVIERNIDSFKNKFEEDAVSEYNWLVSNNVSTTEATETVNNHLFGRVIEFVAHVINTEYTIYDTLTDRYTEAFTKLYTFDGSIPAALDLFGLIRVAETAVVNDYNQIRDTFFDLWDNKPNLHIPFSLITPFLSQSQTELHAWIKRILSGYEDRITAALRKAGRNDEADAYKSRAVQLGLADFNRNPANFEKVYLESFQENRQNEIASAVDAGIPFHTALKTAEDKFSDRVVQFLKFVINAEYGFYDNINRGFADAEAKVSSFEGDISGGIPPEFDLQDVHMAVYNAYTKLNQEFFQVQESIARFDAQYPRAAPRPT